MALDYLPSPGWAVIYGETPSATRWSELGDNDDALATGAGIDDLAILNRHIANASVKQNKLITPTAGSTTLRTSNFTTTSSSPVDITGGSLSQSITTNGGKIFGLLYLSANVSTNTAQLYVTVDAGSPKAVHQFSRTSASYFAIPFILDSIAAGAHTVKVQVSIPGGATFTANIYEGQGMSLIEIGT